MPVTVRYPIDYICSSASNCLYQSEDLPVIGHQPISMVAHLDASYAWSISPILRAMGGTPSDQNLISVIFSPGTTDASTFTPGPAAPSNSTHLIMLWAILQNVSTPTHYTGYADVTYGDVDEIPPPPLAGQPTMVTILG